MFNKRENTYNKQHYVAFKLRNKYNITGLYVMATYNSAHVSFIQRHFDTQLDL